MNTDINLIQNNDYRSWVKELKQRYLSARLKASIDANRTLLDFYWRLGRDIANHQYANTYGSSFYKILSRDLRSEMPDEKGFSERNLRNMYDFYCTYNQVIGNLQQVAANSSESNRRQSADDLLREICSRGSIFIGGIQPTPRNITIRTIQTNPHRNKKLPAINRTDRINP